MQDLLARTLAVAAESHLFACLLVISRDPLVWDAARVAGAHVLAEEGNDLNGALEQGRRYAAGAGVHSVLVLPADLPWLAVDDLLALCRLGEQGDGMVLGPAHDGGTNALHLRLPCALPFCFGEGSYARHLAAAARAGLTPAIYDSPTLRFDLDTPADLAGLHSGLLPPSTTGATVRFAAAPPTGAC
jgi:2-phospho-L-lactate guanylyltransferase